MQSCCNVDFQLIWRRSFANPLFAIEYVDLTNDGMEEIAVASLSGLHVLQVSVNNNSSIETDLWRSGEWLAHGGGVCVCVCGGGGGGWWRCLPLICLHTKYATKGRHGEPFESYFFNPIATSTG